MRWSPVRISLPCVLLVLIVLTSIFYLSFKSELSRSLVINSHCKWPPSNLNNLLRSDSAYDIQICVQSVATASVEQRARQYRIKDLFKDTQATLEVTFDDLANLPRNIWRRAKYPNVYQTYPQDVPLKDIVTNITNGVPVLHMPEYNFPIRILASSSRICSNGSKYDLVVVVKSGVLHWDTRNTFREFMTSEMLHNPNLKVGYVFSMGVPRQRGGRLFDRDGYVMNLTSTAGDELQLYEGRAAEVRQRIDEEIAKYQDIVLADYEDTYYNLTFKSVTNYRWMSAFCGANNVKLFMTIDDDHWVNLSMVQDFMNRVPEWKRNSSVFGFVARHDEAYRSPKHKLYLSYREIPWDLMYPYLRGFAQIIGPHTVDRIAIGSAYTKYNYAPEDVFLGMVAFKLGIPLEDEASMYDHSDYEKRNQMKQPAMVAMSRYFHQ